MIEKTQLDLLRRHYDLSRRERIQELRDEREILQNQHIVNGLGRSGALLGALQRLYHKEIDIAAKALWDGVERFIAPQPGLDTKSADQLRAIFKEKIQELASQLNSSMLQSATGMGLEELGQRFTLKEGEKMVLERLDLELDALTEEAPVTTPHPSQDGDDGSHENGGDSPTAMISYSWDNDAHKAWVRTLATQLRSDGVDVSLDQWDTHPGDQLPAFMESAVRENDFVLIVCTPNYRERSDNRSGGVGYEGNVMTSEVLNEGNERKFVPILRGPDWSASAPTWLAGKIYIDLRGEPYSEKNYFDLLNTLLGRREGRPPLGQPPVLRAPEPGAVRLSNETISPKWKSSSFVDDDERLAINPAYPDPKEIRWRNGPQAFLRLDPLAPKGEWTPTELLDLVSRNEARLLPMGRGSHAGGIWQLRNRHGAIVCDAAGVEENEITDGLTQVFTSGALWGIEGWILRETPTDRDFIPASATEDVFSHTLDNYLRFAQTALELEPPLKIRCGLSGIEGFSITVSSNRVEGYAVEDEVLYETVIRNFDDAAEQILRPLFEMIWEACGLHYTGDGS
jgi:hypothetical protein